MTMAEKVAVLDCQLEHVEYELPKTLLRKALDAVLFTVFGSILLLLTFLAAVGGVYVWFYWSVAQ